MTPTKLLVGQIFVVFGIVILGVWMATQWAAAMLAYQPQLGAPWAMVLGTPIYRPWQLFGWWYHYDAYAPHVFDKAGALAGASGFLGCASAIAGSAAKACRVAISKRVLVAELSPSRTAIWWAIASARPDRLRIAQASFVP